MEKKRKTIAQHQGQIGEVKIVFPLEKEPLQRFENEILWARHVKEHEYQILNSPFFASGISYLDLVTVIPSNQMLVFSEVVQRGGHSTVRIYCPKENMERFNKYWDLIEALDCTFERFNERLPLYSIDIPPATDIHKVYELLNKGEADGIWEYEEANIEHEIL